MSNQENGSSNLPTVLRHEHELAPRDYYYPPTQAGTEGTDWSHLGGLLWQRKWWILATVLLSTAAAVLATRFFIAPIYEAEAYVWVPQGTEGNDGPIRADDVFAGDGLAEIMKSAPVLVPVAEKLGLYLIPVAVPPADSSVFDGFALGDGVLAGEYDLVIGAGSNWKLIHSEGGLVDEGTAGAAIGEPVGFDWRPSAADLRPGSTLRFRVLTARQAAFGLNNRLFTQFDPNSSIITARITGGNPTKAAESLNAVIDQFLLTANDFKNSKREEVVEILTEQVEYSANRLQDAEFALQSHKVTTITLPTETNAVATPGGTMATRDPIFDDYFNKRITAQQLSTDLRELERATSAARSGQDITAALQYIPAATNSPQLQATMNDLISKEAQRRALLVRYTEQHPEVSRLATEIHTMRTVSIPNSLNQLTEEVRNQLAVVERQITSQTSELQQIPTRTIEEARLTREVQLAEGLHNDLLNRLKSAELAAATNLVNLQVLERAVPPPAPSKNTAPRIILMAAMASLGLGVGGVLLLDKLDRRIRSPDQLVGSLGLPVLGVVPRLDPKATSDSAGAAMAVESFRALRTQISHAGESLSGSTMITSPAPQEGKSMVSANLAISYASAGHKTVLIDTDTRRGRANEMFGLPKSPGLADYLLERASLEEVAQETELEGLTVIARGSTREFKAELLECERMHDLLDRLKDDYDVVVLDAPPLAAGADALHIGSRCDKVILVVRAGTTDEELARNKLAMVGNVDLPVVGAVLNAVPKSAPYYNYYVHYYYAEA